MRNIVLGIGVAIITTACYCLVGLETQYSCRQSLRAAVYHLACVSLSLSSVISCGRTLTDSPSVAAWTLRFFPWRMSYYLLIPLIRMLPQSWWEQWLP